MGNEYIGMSDVSEESFLGSEYTGMFVDEKEFKEFKWNANAVPFDPCIASQFVAIYAHQQQEQILHVPRVIPQERIFQQTVEQVVETPVPMTQEEVAHVPKAAQHERNHHFHAEEIVDLAVEQKVEEIVHAPVALRKAEIVQNPAMSHPAAQPQNQLVSQSDLHGGHRFGLCWPILPAPAAGVSGGTPKRSRSGSSR